LAFAGFALGILAQPASAAVVLCSSGPGIDLTADQCLASGNSDLANVSSAIALATGTAPTGLALYGKSDDDDYEDLFSFDPDPNSEETLFTDWIVLDGTLIKYVVVKTALQIKIYELPGLGASTGFDFSTVGMTNPGGPQPAISHLAFYTAAVIPEPATWAMLIAGFGAVGAGMRRRQGLRHRALV
jgi:hypothetical protein